MMRMKLFSIELSFLLLGSLYYMEIVSSFSPIIIISTATTSQSILRMSNSEEVATTTGTTVTNDDDTSPVALSLPKVPSNCKRLFLVRHGEVINPGGDRPVYYGAMDVPLSPLGQEEAKAAAQYLSQYNLQYIFSSPLSRAIYGAEQVQKLQQQQQQQNDNDNKDVDTTAVIINDGFKELDRGSWCGKTKDEIGKEAMTRFDACDESATPEGGESYSFLKQRVLKARDEALGKMSPGQAAAVVSHLQVTRSILSDAKDIPIDEMAKLKIATASVTCVDYDMDKGTQTVHFESFKPEIGLGLSKDLAS